MYPPDDPTRPCRPKAGHGLMMMMMMKLVVVVRAGVRVKDCLPIGIIGRQLRDTDQTMGYAATTITICFALLNICVIKHLEACAQNLYIQKVC